MSKPIFFTDNVLDFEAVTYTEEEYDAIDHGCECGSGMRWHLFGKDESCEYFEHHCDMCHERAICTIPECDMVKI